MSLSTTLNTGLSSLLTAQSNIAVASTNISNADTEGYTTKSATNAARINNGVADGVEATVASSDVDARLLNSLYASKTDAGYAAAVQSYYDYLESGFGSVGDDSSLSEQLTDIESALTTLSLDPGDTSSQYALVQEFEDVAGLMNSLSNDIQDQRAAIDQEIETSVSSVNQLLAELDTLNEQISKQTAVGGSTADLEDERNQALLDLSAYMDVQSFTDDNNRLNVYTGGGKALLTSEVQELSYSATSPVTGDMTYANGDFDDITVGGTSITDDISGGTIGGLIDMRDEDLVETQDTLDQLAAGLIDAVNAVSNTGTAYPAPNSLTGSEAVSGADTVSATGEFRVALVDGSGTVQAFDDIDMSAISTVDDLVTAVDAISGVSAQVNGDGNLEISADNADYGIALNEMDSSVGADGEGASAYFGLNDLLTGSDASSIGVSSTLSDDTSLMPTGQLSDDAALAVGDSALSSGDASTVSALSDVLSSDQSFASTGLVGSRNESFADYAASLHSAFTAKVSEASDSQELAAMTYEAYQDDFTNAYGVNVDEELTALTSHQQSYEYGAHIISTVDEMFDVLMGMVS